MNGNVDMAASIYKDSDPMHGLRDTVSEAYNATAQTMALISIAEQLTRLNDNLEKRGGR